MAWEEEKDMGSSQEGLWGRNEAHEPSRNKPPLVAVTKGGEGEDLVLVGEARTEESTVVLRRAMSQNRREGITVVFGPLLTGR